MIVGFPRMQRLWPRVSPSVVQWLRLIQEAESAAAAAGASLWYVPPAAYADRSINGPFVGSDGSGGVPAVGSGVVGWLRDAAGGAPGANLSNNGDFSAGLTGWSAVGQTVNAASGGIATVTFGAGSGGLFQDITVPVGGWVVIDVVVRRSSGTGPGAAIWLVPRGDFAAPNFQADVQNTSWHTVTLRCRADATTVRVYLQVFGSGSAIEVDSVSVRSTPGSHATQSTSANRPILVAAPGAAAAAAGFGALALDGVNDRLIAPTDLTRTLVWSLAAPPGIGTQQSIVGNNRGTAYYRGTTGEITFVVPAVDDRFSGLVPAGPHVASVSRAAGGAPSFRLNGATATGAVVADNGLSDTVTNIGFTGSALSYGLIAAAPTALTPAQLAPIERLGAFLVGASYPGL